jgi:hypothetical protein
MEFDYRWLEVKTQIGFLGNLHDTEHLYKGALDDCFSYTKGGIPDRDDLWIKVDTALCRLNYLPPEAKVPFVLCRC